MAGTFVVTPPACEPVSMGEARDHLRLTSSDDSGILAGYLIAARTHVENETGRALITRTLDKKFDADWPLGQFGSRIILPSPPLIAVASITYTDNLGAQQTLAANQYQVSPGELYGVVVPAYGVTWPTVRNQLDAITVRYTAGYGASPGSVPEAIRLAILQLTGHFYDNRLPVVVAATVAELPMSVCALLSPYRVLL
jgi:uncharacterized phiE125 gp8 family phage protein